MLEGIQGAVLKGDMPLQRLAWKAGSSALTLDMARCAHCLSGAAKQPSESASLSSMRAGVSNHILLASCCSEGEGRQAGKMLPLRLPKCFANAVDIHDSEGNQRFTL